MTIPEISSELNDKKAVEYLIIPIPGTAANLWQAFSKDKKKQLGCTWRGWKNAAGKIENPYWSIPKENIEDLVLALKSIEIPIPVEDIEFRETIPPIPKHVKIAALGDRYNEALKVMEAKEKEAKDSANDAYNQGLITEAEWLDRLRETYNHFEKEREFLEHNRDGNYYAANILAQENPDSPFSSEEISKAIADNECGDAALFKKLRRNDFIYDPNEKVFYLWNGMTWEVDKNKIRHQTLEMVADCYARESERISANDPENTGNSKYVKELRTRSKLLKTSRRMDAVLAMSTVGARDKGGITFDGQWDECREYLPCINGLVDLSTGRLIKPQPDHFIRKHSSVTYDESAKCPYFEAFIRSIMDDREELIQFLQRLIGYAARGTSIEHIFVFLYGKRGRNGKGTLLRILSKVLGHIAREFQSELLLLQRNPPSSGTPRPDLVHLHGTRFAMFSEINDGRKIDSAVLKNLSGGDPISARSLFSNEIKNFLPTHTLFLQANYRPKAPADDEALWRRAILIPFDVTFVDNPKSDSKERKIDLDLEGKLLHELSGILRWIVEGALLYKTAGLKPPKEVRDAVNEYRSENDGIGSFIREKCVKDKTLSSPRGKFTKAVQQYCLNERFNKPTAPEIATYLGIVRK